MNPLERHPLEPYLPDGTRLILLGSFPPARKRWCMDFFYPNFTNDMWRVFGLLFFGDKEHFVDAQAKRFRQTDIEELLCNQRIGIYDTATVVRRTRNTASDKDLEVVQPTNLSALLRRAPGCHALVATGQKAAELAAAHFGIAPPPVGAATGFSFEGRPMHLYRMPSTSRAYPLRVEQKAEYYGAMLAELDCLTTDETTNETTI